MKWRVRLVPRPPLRSCSKAPLLFDLMFLHAGPEEEEEGEGFFTTQSLRTKERESRALACRCHLVILKNQPLDQGTHPNPIIIQLLLNKGFGEHPLMKEYVVCMHNVDEAAQELSRSFALMFVCLYWYTLLLRRFAPIWYQTISGL